MLHEMTDADWEEVKRLSESARECAAEHLTKKYTFCENYGCMSLIPLIQAIEWLQEQKRLHLQGTGHSDLKSMRAAFDARSA